MTRIAREPEPTMTIRQNPPAGAPVWVDLMTSDIDKSTAFYGALFGWEAEPGDPQFGGYTNFTTAGERVAGVMPAQPGDPSDVWSVYLKVDDAAATVQAAKDAGGTVYVDAMAVGDLGVMAVVADPGGASIGMWQPGEHRGGVVAAEGAPCHFELHTRDYDASVAFYEKVFGWPTEPISDVPEFRYTLLTAEGLGDGEQAGIMDAAHWLPEGVPAHWSVYFGVADADAALAQVEELGGAVIQAAETTPYGRLATASDATGAVFKIRQDV
jgi:predicted enzyme related to lactoylglutathione lyase